MTLSRFPVPLVALVVVLACPQGAYAHRLIGAYRVLSGRRVQVQSFFPGGYPPRDTTVKVTRPDQSVLAEGELDEKGLFVFGFEHVEDLSVVIRAAAGTIDEHTTQFTIPANDLAGSTPVVPQQSKTTSAARSRKDTKVFPLRDTRRPSAFAK